MVKSADADDFLRDNPEWWENRKFCTCHEQTRQDEHLCAYPVNVSDRCNCCPYCTQKCNNYNNNP